MADFVIGSFSGYTITYSSGTRRFYLNTAEGDQVGCADDQASLENKAETLAKGTWERWPVIWSSDLVTVTSFNPLEGKVWVVEDVGQQRHQVDVAYQKLYPRTPENLARIAQLEDIEAQVAKLSEQRRALANGFTGQLTRADFDAHIKPLKKAKV